MTDTGIWRSRALAAASALVATLVLAREARRLLVALGSDQPISAYQAPLFWVDYRDGFVRRGLPGQVLSLATGDPSYGATKTAALLILAVALVGVVGLALALARRASSWEGRVTVASLVLAAPFTMHLLVLDFGRYDAIGIAVATLGAVAVASHRVRPWLGLVALAAGIAVATASEEFLVAYLAPLVVLAAYRLPRRTSRAAVAAAVLAPGAAVAAASLLLDAPPGIGASSLNAARAAGVGESIPAGNDAATLLAASRDQQLAIFDRYSSSSLLLTAVACAITFAVLALVLHHLLGRPAPKQAALVGGWVLAVSIVLSFTGVDFLRWFALAFVAFASCLLLLPSSRPAPSLTTWRTGALVAVAVLVCVAGQKLGISPIDV